MAETSAAFTVKVDGRAYTLDRITLGDWRMLKTEFGLNSSDIIVTTKNDQGEPVQFINLDDPNVIVGLMVASLRHERPHAPIATLIAEIEALTMDGFEFPTDEDDEDDAEEADPTEAVADDEAADAQSKGGKSGKRQKTLGRQS